MFVDGGVMGNGHDVLSTQPSRLVDAFVRSANVPKNYLIFKKMKGSLERSMRFSANHNKRLNAITETPAYFATFVFVSFTDKPP